MAATTKMSPAFKSLLAESGPNEKRDAIVIYRRPERAKKRKGRLKKLEARLSAVKVQALAQAQVHATMTKAYHREVGKDFDVAPIGGSALPVAWMEVTRNSLKALEADENVVAVMPNQQVHLIEPTAESFVKPMKSETKAGMTWGLEELGIPNMWKKTKGKDINVAVLDTGVYGQHDTLAGRVTEFTLVDPLGREIGATKPFDSGSHGTHVCGTIAGGKSPDGVSIGVAPQANLQVGAVLLGSPTLLAIVQGMAWAVNKGANIVNMSLGLSVYEPNFDKFVDMLLDYDVLPVIAVGNDSWGNVSSPGSAENALAVGAAERTKPSGLGIASFSSGGSLLFQEPSGPRYIDKPDVVAPGRDIFSAIPRVETPDGVWEYAYLNGTSMAAPHVAGVAALLMAAKPNATARDVAQALEDTAKHPSSLSPDNRWGYGLVQPEDALKAL